MEKEHIRFGVGWDPAPGFEEIEFSILADELGLDSVWPGDSPTNRTPRHDPHIMLSYIAAKTQQVKLATAVYLLPLCHPVRLALQLRSLDVFSHGRVILGVGVGGEFPKQFEAFGVSVDERGTRTDEYIRIIRSLWTDPVANFHGRYFNFDGIIVEPKPVQKPIPIWIGGRPGGIETGPDGQPQFKSKTDAIRRAGTLGDGWIPYYVSLEAYRESVKQVRQVAEEHGRAPSDIVMGLNNFWIIANSYDEAFAKAAGRRPYGKTFDREQVERYYFLGTAKDIVPKLEKFLDAGCRYFVCKLNSRFDEVPGHLEYLAKEIVPHFR